MQATAALPEPPAPTAPRPPDALLRDMLGVLAGVGAIAGSGLALLRLIEGRPQASAVLVDLAFCVIGLAALALVRRGRLRAAAALLLWGGWMLNALFLTTHGGIDGLDWPTFTVLIGAAGWMLGQRATLAMTAASMALYLLAGLGSPLGWFGTAPQRSVLIGTVYHAVIFGLAAAMAVLARRSYRQRIDHERRQAEVLGAREARLRTLSQVIEQSPEGVTLTDPQGRIDYLNPVAAQRLGEPADRLIGREALQLDPLRHEPPNLQALRSALAAGEVWRGQSSRRDGTGQPRIDALRVSPLRDAQGGITHHVWIQQDITARHEAEARLAHLARHDALTGLPNRQQLEERLQALLARESPGPRHLALLMLNIDRFKTINEARGQAAGDALLLALSERLRTLLCRHELLARLGADDFALLLPDLEADASTASHQAYGLACQVHEAMQQPLRLAPTDAVTVTTSLGIALCRCASGESAAELLRRASNALGEAKRLGGAHTAFFESAMGETAVQRFRIERELREALAEGQLRLFLQPQVDANGRWSGAEALVRWQHPERGMISPGLFIPIAEESDLIVGVGRWVFGEAVRLIGEAARQGRALPLSVNLSPRQFRQADFLPWLQALLEAHDVDPGLLTLEITEGLVIGNVEQAVARMRALRALGVQFSVDDFGTGYSSLAYLKRLPVSELKIDRSFVQEAPRQADDAALVETILSVARHMRLKVVAEGVEEVAQAHFLAAREPGIVLQGYLHGRPGPAAEWLQRWQDEGALPALAAAPSARQGQGLREAAP
ncbi:MAG: EAL domain-containing protein [Burkholderiaceae bacterium]|nr:EAL domain-containing protein [Burkholderiaceae bacterium]